jgi:hypothetical protein
LSRISDSKKALAAEQRAAKKAVQNAPECTGMRKNTKSNVITIPRPKQERVFQRYVAGDNYSKIARDEHLNRRTVTKIIAVRAEDQKEYIAKTREIAVGLVVPALACVKQSIDNGNAEMAYRLLEDIGTIPSSRKGAGKTAADDAPETDITQDVRAQQILVSRLNPKQRMIWEMFSMFVDKKEAYGELDAFEELPKKPTLSESKQSPS